MTRRRRTWALAAVLALATGAVAYAQRSDVRRPMTITIGQPAGAAPVVRGGPHRDGLVHAALPRPPLRVSGKLSVGGGQIDQPALVTTDAIVVVTTRGDVVWLPPDLQEGSTELARQSLNVAATSSSPPAMLGNGTVVVVGGTSEAVAVGVDKTGVRFRTQLSGSVGSVNPLDAIAPLALDDGGVAVATSTEIVLLDSSGNIRLRAQLPEALVGPLLASGGRILGTARSGVVYSWSPGGTNGRDVARVGSFPAQGGGLGQDEVAGGAILTSDDSLMAVVRDTRLMTLDLRQGLAVPLATFPGGGYLGPMTFRRGVAYGMAGLPNHTYVVGIDNTGQEVMRVPVGASTATAADGGPLPYTTQPHVPVIVDDAGTLAFAAPEGPVGIVDPAGIVTTLDPPCSRVMRAGGRNVTSLVSGGPGSFIITCSSGTVIRISHQ
jgi:hypothetical protein